MAQSNVLLIRSSSASSASPSGPVTIAVSPDGDTTPVADEGPPTFVYLVGRVNQGVRRELQRRLRPAQLSVPELTVLSVLQHRPGLSNAQLARRSLFTSQAMNDVVASLERRRLIERCVDPSHGLIRQTRLTRAGYGMLRRVSPTIDALQAELLQDVAEAEREVVGRGLAAAMRRLSRPPRGR